MSLADFLAMQEELIYQFGWLARWWLIAFIAGGVLLSAFLFFLSVVSSWLDTWASG